MCPLAAPGRVLPRIGHKQTPNEPRPADGIVSATITVRHRYHYAGFDVSDQIRHRHRPLDVFPPALDVVVLAPTCRFAPVSACLETLVMAKAQPVIEISADLLQRLHRIHRQRSDLQSQIDRGPRQIAAGEAMVQKCRQALAESLEAIKRSKRLADQKQGQLKEREERLVTLQGKLNAAASNREYDSFKEQIAADQQANSVLSDEILETLERIDQLERDRQDRQRELDQRLAEQETMERSVHEKVAALREDLAAVEAEREQAEQLIPERAKPDYLRLVAARGEEALAPVDGDTCGGCYQTLTTQLVSQLMLSQLVRCPSCNAFLYRRIQG